MIIILTISVIACVSFFIWAMLDSYLYWKKRGYNFLKGKFMDCACGFAEPYGYVPEAGCPIHDTKEFLEDIERLEAFTIQKERRRILDEIKP